MAASIPIEQEPASPPAACTPTTATTPASSPARGPPLRPSATHPWRPPSARSPDRTSRELDPASVSRGRPRRGGRRPRTRAARGTRGLPSGRSVGRSSRGRQPNAVHIGIPFPGLETSKRRVVGPVLSTETIWLCRAWHRPPTVTGDHIEVGKTLNRLEAACVRACVVARRDGRPSRRGRADERSQRRGPHRPSWRRSSRRWPGSRCWGTWHPRSRCGTSAARAFADIPDAADEVCCCPPHCP